MRWRLSLVEPQQHQLPHPLPLPAAFTWEVKANDHAYHEQFRRKGFLCWRQKKYRVSRP